MPRLLILCEYPTLNGGERSMLATLPGVQAAGFDVAVAAPPAGPLADAVRRREVDLLPFDVDDPSCKQPPLAARREALAELLRRRRPDLLHANSLSMGRLSGPVARELEIPSLAHLRDVLKLSRRAIGDLNAHTRLLAVSAATRDFLVAEGLDASKTRVLFNGVDLSEFRPRAPTGYLHDELRLAPEAKLLGTIGQIGLRKGQDMLARAAAVVAGQRDDAQFLIVGERFSEKEESRRFEAELRRAARGMLAGRLHLLGRREDVPRLLNELTLLVHPARQEPLGRVLLEAAASGTPTVATDVGGTREVFPPGSGAAVLVPPDDTDALGAAILELLDDAPRRRALGRAARQRAEEAFDARKTTAGLLVHYGEVLG